MNRENSSKSIEKEREMAILIVDDEPTILELLSRMLTGFDYRISLATSGELALQYVHSHAVALILLDVKMPIMDGFEVCHRLKANPDSADIPIIFISALHDIKDKLEAFKTGGVDYITKPFRKTEVLARVRVHLELSHTRRSLKEARDLLEERVQERTRELANSEQRFRSIFQGIPDAMALTNSNREITLINPAFSKIFGYSLKELEGQQTVLLYKSPKEFERQGRIRFNLTAEKKLKPYEVNYKRKNGEVFPGETIGAAITDDEGSTIGFLGVIRDITERKQAEEVLHRYKHILSVTNDLMSFIDRNYVYQAVNEPYLHVHQKTHQEIIGHSVANLLGADVFKKFVQDKLDQCLAGETIHYQEWFDFPGMKQRYMDIFYHPFFDLVGEVTGVVVSSRDITESKLAEQALQESNIALKVLVNQQQNIKEDVEQQILAKLIKLVFPYLNLLQGRLDAAKKEEYLAIIRAHLSSVTDSFALKLSDPFLKLTPREILVADLVRQGRKTQDIAEILNLSLRTVEAYRMQLRKKLGLNTKKENLRKYLLDSFEKE